MSTQRWWFKKGRRWRYWEG